MRGRNPVTTINLPTDGLSASESAYQRQGWKKDAARVLEAFIGARDVEGKLPFIMNRQTLESRVREFYGPEEIDDSDTPAATFSANDLSDEDRSRGLFMMTYDQPPQFDMREFFRPLASLEVQYGLNEADLLLSTVARASNFAMEPLRVHAFFKRTDEGLKLDWEVFIQTKYRRFRNFVDLPQPGQPEVFRVLIVEDVPDRHQAGQGTRTYRLCDPAHTEDTARVVVKEDSVIGRALSVINWRGSEDGRPHTRTATVELAWTGGETPPALQIRRFICWEFLGLGGTETPPAVSPK
jgi:hypothetical protein